LAAARPTRYTSTRRFSQRHDQPAAIHLSKPRACADNPSHLSIDPGRFQSGRHFAAWLGLTPKEHSTGGRQRLGGISRAGNERLRQLLVLGATTVIRFAKPGSKSASAWLLALLERKPRKLAAVALANKMARIVWAMMATGEAYRGSKKVATPAAMAAAAA